MEHVHKGHNFAAVLRNCDAVGLLEAHAVLLRGRMPSARRMSSAGSLRWVQIHPHPDVATGAAALRARGFQVLAAHLSERARNFRDVDYTRPTAILLGQEKDGVSDEALAACDGEVIIPMVGMVTSLNVSVAAALILFEAQRQRQDAGFYDHPRLDAETYRRTLFEWAYPRQAAVCRNHGSPYPDLDDDGEILGPLPR